MSEYRFLYGIIKKNIFCWIIVLLFLTIGFQFWIIRSRGYEITTLRNENISCRADAEDMRRMLAELTNDFELIPREKNIERIQRTHYFSDGLAENHYRGFGDFLHVLEVDDSSVFSPEHKKGYYSKKSATVIYADERILSYCLDFETYTGGAHENYNRYMGTIARSPDGKRPSQYLSLSDIVSEDQLPEMKRRLLESYINELIRRDDMLRFNDNNEFTGVPPDPTENFYYDDKGLHFFYNPYDIGCFAEGTFDLCIDWPLPEVIFPPGFNVPAITSN